MQTYLQGRGSAALHILSDSLGALPRCPGCDRAEVPVEHPCLGTCQGHHFGHLQLRSAVEWPLCPLCALAHALGPLAGHSPSLSWELSFLWDSGLRRGGDLGFKCQGRSGGSRQHLLAQGSQQPSLHL